MSHGSRGPAGRNRLAAEKSPYLLQHAGNPVDWYPWGEEAFERARRDDRPVFLSIGYSTCHWCHVMERESFEDAEIASLMNRAFVCVKVDREERPDVDHVYMTACQMMTGSGGWPLTILLTPDRRPFFAGTYIPPAALRTFIPRVEEAWREHREAVVADSARVSQVLQQSMTHERGDVDGMDLMRRAYHELAARFDSVHGGFGAHPKFPTPHTLLFLLRYWKRTGTGAALEMVETTLDMMRRGGICDQIGYGFHRYSTDAQWLVPHFEKMLYDQAMMLLAYVEAGQAGGRAEYRACAEEIAAYVMRDLSAPGGGFYSAEDADSEGVEGKFYVWSQGELQSILGQDAALAAEYFGVSPDGNFTEEATGHRTGANILHLTRPAAEAARALGIDDATLRARIESIRVRLLNSRAQRIRPHLDDKVLADWNGLMIAALARSGRVLGHADHVDRARQAADFIMEKLAGKGGGLLHRYRDGDAAIDGMLDDYAFFAWGLIELYEATFEERFLERAIAYTNHMTAHFRDDAGGGYFMTASGAEALVVRPKEVYDGATPSGNSVAATNLARLARFTGDMTYDDAAHAVTRAFAGQVARAPMAHTQLLVALDFLAGPTVEVVLSGTRGAADVARMQAALDGVYQPGRVVLFRPAEAPEAIARLAPYTREQTPPGGVATAYVCRGFACERPTTDVEQMVRLLAGGESGD